MLGGLFRITSDNSTYRKYALFVHLCREEKEQTYVKGIYRSLSAPEGKTRLTTEQARIRSPYVHSNHREPRSAP
jgi:hypothetical protein